MDAVEAIIRIFIGEWSWDQRLTLCFLFHDTTDTYTISYCWHETKDHWMIHSLKMFKNDSRRALYKKEVLTTGCDEDCMKILVDEVCLMFDLFPKDSVCKQIAINGSNVHDYVLTFD